jgi:hypothetical protein
MLNISVDSGNAHSSALHEKLGVSHSGRRSTPPSYSKGQGGLYISRPVNRGVRGLRTGRRRRRAVNKKRSYKIRITGRGTIVGI